MHTILNFLGNDNGFWILISGYLKIKIVSYGKLESDFCIEADQFHIDRGEGCDVLRSKICWRVYLSAAQLLDVQGARHYANKESKLAQDLLPKNNQLPQ